MSESKGEVKLSPKKILVEALKDAGLDVAEEAAVGVAKAVFGALGPFFAATENKYDDLAIPLLAVVEPQVLSLLDKIDGEDDPGR